MILGLQRAGKEYCVHLYWPDEDTALRDRIHDKEGWDVVVPTNVVNINNDGYDSK